MHHSATLCCVAKKKDPVTKRPLRALFGPKKAPEKKPPSMNASVVLRPELIVPQSGKRAPRATTRRVAGPLSIHELPSGIVHVVFNRDLFDGVVTKDAVVRDPVTRRLSRKKLTDGMRRVTEYYDRTGRLLDENNTDW